MRQLGVATLVGVIVGTVAVQLHATEVSGGEETASGWALGWHVLLVAGIVPENVTPCSQGVPCSETYFRLLGIITIPQLAWLAFFFIIALLVAAHIKARK